MKSRRSFAISPLLWSADITSNNYDLLQKIAGIGFDAVEIPLLGRAVDVRRLNDALGSSKSRLGKRLEPIVMGACTLSTDIASEDPAVVKNGIAYIKHCIQTSSDLGGSLVCGPLYAAPDKRMYLTPNERRRQLERVANSLKEVAAATRDRSVVVALELLNRYETYLLNTAEQGRELVDMVGAEGIGLHLDIFHMNIEERSLYDAIVTAGEKLLYLHVCENDRGAPGTGPIDWQEVKTGLDKIGYSNAIGYESFSPSDSEVALSQLSWRQLDADQDTLAVKALEFLRKELS